MVDVDVTGVPELEKALEGLSGTQAQAIREKAIAAGARALVGPTRNAAPLGPTGNLRKKVGARKGRSSKGGDRDPAVYVVGSTAPHRHLVIRGTRQRTTRSGASRGRMPANPFVSRAWLASRSKVTAKIRAVYAAEVEKAWRR